MDVASGDSAFALTAAQGVVLGFASILDRPGPLLLGAEWTDTDELHRRERRTVLALPQGDVEFVGSIGFDRPAFCEAAALIASGLRVDHIVTSQRRLEEVPGLVGGAWRDELKIIVAGTDADHSGRDASAW